MTAGTSSNARAIRVLIGKPGLDGHDVGAKLVGRALTDAGMQVTYTGLRQAPAPIDGKAREGRGEGKIWGACPKNATHLFTFLDRVVAAGLCRRVYGATVNLDTDYSDFYFYIAERAQAKEFMQR